MSKGELRSLYIAKDDEYDFGISAAEPADEEKKFLRWDAAKYFFEHWRDTRLPTDALITLASENQKLQELIISPPENRALIDLKYGVNNPNLVFAATHIHEFFRRQVFTQQSIGEQSFTFPPSHPVSRTFYKQHPLASYRPEKRNYFIPSSMYDAILFAEREAELIGILVDLGGHQNPHLQVVVKIRACQHRCGRKGRYERH